MALNLNEIFSPAAIAAYWTNDPTNAQPYASDALFPARKKVSMELKWLRGHKGVGVSLKPSAFDTKATFRTRKGIQVTETSMPFFREGTHIDESDRRKIISVLDSNQEFAADVINRIYDDTAQLITGARIVPERMVWQLLAPKTGKPGISIESNGVSYVYDYDPDGTWQQSNYKALATKEKWDAPTTATPIATMATAANTVLANTGEVITEAYMNTNTFHKMIAADEVKNRFLTVMKTTTAVLVDSEARSVVESASGIRIHLYDKMFKPEETAAAEKYLPDGYVVLAPSGSLGNMYYVATPEEVDLMAGISNAQVSVVNTGVAITTKQEVNPVSTDIIASEIVLPSFERMDAVYCIKAY